MRTLMSAMAMAMAVAMTAGPAWAQGSPGGTQGPPGGSQGGPRQGPPPEAISACDGGSEGTSCSFEAPFGTVSGTCRMPPRLVCAPSGGPGQERGGQQGGQQGGPGSQGSQGRGQRGPGQGQQGRGQMGVGQGQGPGQGQQGPGQGGQGPGQGQQGPGQGGQGQQGRRPGPPPEAIEACAQGSEGGACSFTAPFGEVSGTCRAPHTQVLACVPTGGPPRGREQ